jgi:putative transposase
VGAPALLRHWAAVGGATKGELKAAIEALAERTWRHPTTGEPVRFGFSTIERWYYRAFKERSDPVGRLRRKLRSDAGQQPAMSDAVRLRAIRRAQGLERKTPSRRCCSKGSIAVRGS